MLDVAATDTDALHRHRGTRAIQRMVEFAPGTGGLALWVHHEDIAAGATDDAAHDYNASPVETDGHTLRYRPAFEALPIGEQVGLVAHEVLHIALRHPQRYLDLQALLGDVDLRLFNICADAIVNSSLSHLSWLSLPAAAVHLDRLLASALGLHTPVEAALLEWDVESLYRAIDDRRVPESAEARTARQQQAGGSTKRAGGMGGRESPSSAPDSQPAAGRADGPRAAQARSLGARCHADLAPDPQTLGAPQLQAEQTRQWSERIARAHAGDGEFSMLRTLIADVPSTRTPWEHVLRTQLARSLAPQPALSWSRPSRSYIANQGRGGPHRRMPWEPGRSATKSVPRLVVIVDVSGSIEDTLMDRFASEIEAITRRLESSLVLVIGDDRVQRVAQFAPGQSNLRELEFHGGGGTDFTPLLEEANRHAPDIGVVLTDLQGPARFRPRWPVIWAVPPTFSNALAPFGRVLALRY